MRSCIRSQGTTPLSITITERRLKLLRHILRLPNDCPARKAMRYYFEERKKKNHHSDNSE